MDRFRAPSDGELPDPRPKRPRRRQSGWFVKGPIPGEWLSRAARLPGKALHVGLAVWYQFGLSKAWPVVLTGRVLERFGVRPDAGRRGLRQLEGDKLVSVNRHPGRCPRVTVRKTDASD